MSYTPDEQRLTPSITKILEGIMELKAAIAERLIAGPEAWKEAHLREITALDAKLSDIRLELTLIGDKNH